MSHHQVRRDPTAVWAPGCKRKCFDHHFSNYMDGSYSGIEPNSMMRLSRETTQTTYGPWAAGENMIYLDQQCLITRMELILELRLCEIVRIPFLTKAHDMDYPIVLYKVVGFQRKKGRLGTWVHSLVWKCWNSLFRSLFFSWPRNSYPSLLGRGLCHYLVTEI